MRDVQRPAHAPRNTQSFSGQIPVRFDGAPNTPFEGDTRWRGVTDFEHGTLCRVFNLDPNRFFFDLPSSCRGSGSNNGRERGNRTINGFVMMAGRDAPVAKLTIVRESDRFKDVDPLSESDFFNLNHS